MHSTELRTLIDILKEDYTNPSLDSAADTGTTPADNTADPKSTTPAAKAEPKAKPETVNSVEQIQQALVDAGFELPRFGVDGKMGPETQAAIKAAEMVLGRKPTGSIKPEELKGLGQRVENNALTQSLATIEAILAKYKIRAESIEQRIDQYVLENINEFTAEEQLEIWRCLTEADIYVPPSSGGSARDPGRQARMQALANPNPMISRANDPFGLGGAKQPPAATPPASAPKSKLYKFGHNLGKRVGLAKGAGKAAAAKAGAKMAARFLPFAGWALLAYDVGSALYDTFAKTDMSDLAPEDQAAIQQHLPTILNYYKDPKLGATLPEELQARVRNVINGLTALEADLEQPAAKPAEPGAKAAEPQSKPSTQSTSGLLIANEPFIAGQPLSDKQLRVMKMAMDMGNSYSPEVMAQYQRQVQQT